MALPKRTTTRITPGRVFFLMLLTVCTALFLAPLVWLVSASLKTRAEVFSSAWLPDPVAWGNYVRVWEAAPILDWLTNSLVVGVLAASAVTLSSALVAFGFANFRFRGRDALFGLVLATMMLPGAVTMIPTFLIWDALGFINTLTPLWAGNLFGSAFYIFLLRQFYLGLPRELFEAARIDGASTWRLFRDITMPLLLPFAAIIALITIVQTLQVFPIVQTMTGGGPFFASEVMEVYIYRNAFGEQGIPRLGYASAAGVFFGMTVMVIAILQGLGLRKAQRARRDYIGGAS